ncbi:MAG TPA: phosphatidylglycerophosphatase A [Bacteroidota bacterium]|nr:phosphatidylglycerophosphatase A [Bacteroidota bacterium]
MSTSSSQEPAGSPAPVSFLTRLIATGLYSGYIPWASGTFGTLVGIIVCLIPGVSDSVFLGVLIVVFFFVGAATSSRVAHAVGHKLTRSAELAKATFQSGSHGNPDPSIVVIDEIVGVWITLFAIPLSPLSVATAFFAFRAFDILKPPPARQVEQIPDGWGIMLDDVVAGVYANIATRIALFVLSLFLPNL